MTWHNVSDPPDDSRTVEVMTDDGQQFWAHYDPQRNLWFEGYIAEPINPIGWRELEVSDEQE